MDDYPDFLVDREASKFSWEDGREINQAVNGAVDVRSLWSAAKPGEVVLVHPSITDAERATLEVFYAAHRTVSFNFTQERLTLGLPVAMIFGKKPPQFEIANNPLKWRATVTMMGA